MREKRVIAAAARLSAIGLGLSCLLAANGARAWVDNYIPWPPGYGFYCSMTGSGGGWSFKWDSGTTGDPCNEMLATWPQGSVQRAGLWNQYGDNNILIRCDQGTWYGRAYGNSALSAAYNQAAGNTSCTITVAPVSLPIFANPYKPRYGESDPNVGVEPPTGFQYDVFGSTWSPSEFGQPGGTYTSFDRYGTADDTLSTEQAYDWTVHQDPNTNYSDYHRQIVAVARGIVRGVQNRWICNTSLCLCNGMAWDGVSPTPCGGGKGTNYQAEIAIEHQVGPASSWYCENFITVYHHMHNALDFVTVGQHVNQGDVIGYVGHINQGPSDYNPTDPFVGNSGNDHLDLMVLRTTNLSNYFWYTFQMQPGDSSTPPGASNNNIGFNGRQGQIDPFGWDAPSNVDPYAWKFLNTPNIPAPTFAGPGAFSINLWNGVHTPRVQCANSGTHASYYGTLCCRDNTTHYYPNVCP